MTCRWSRCTVDETEIRPMFINYPFSIFDPEPLRSSMALGAAVIKDVLAASSEGIVYRSLGEQQG